VVVDGVGADDDAGVLTSFDEHPGVVGG